MDRLRRLVEAIGALPDLEQLHGAWILVATVAFSPDRGDDADEPAKQVSERWDDLDLDACEAWLAAVEPPPDTRISGGTIEAVSVGTPEVVVTLELAADFSPLAVRVSDER